MLESLAAMYAAGDVMSKIIAITGATGFVGRELGIALVRAGWQVRAICRDPARVRGVLPFPAQIYRLGDDAALDGVQAVVHLAGEPVSEGRWTKDQKHRIRDSRVRTTRELADSIRRLGKKPEVFLQASAIGFYGDRGDDKLDEGQNPSQDFLGEVCAAWEHEGLSLARIGIRAAALRIGIVLGHQGGALPKIAGFYHMGIGGRLGSGRQWVSWIHIDDLVALFMHALTNPNLIGPINAVAPTPCRFAEFHEAMKRALGCRGFVPAPSLGLKLLLGEKAAIVLASQYCLANLAEASGFSFRYRTIDEALTALYSDSVSPNAARLLLKQWVPKIPTEIWPFFSDEHNLERLTPPWLNFNVLGRSTPDMGKGTEIKYRLKLHGVPLHWLTRISEWQPPERFIDTQLKGPYRLWHHLHTFEPLAGGTLLTDSVQYLLPLGTLGSLGGLKFVQHDVEKIFSYRQAAVAKIFGES